MKQEDTMSLSGTAPDTTAAEAFETYMVPTIFGPWSRLIVDRLAPEPGESLLDVACGTGAAARYAARLVAPGGFVGAIDIDPAMIAHGRTLDGADAVDWRVGDAQALPWPDASFDAVLCAQGYQFFADRVKALREMRRVLKAGGRLAVAVFCALPYCPGHEAIAAALEKHEVDAAGIQRPYSFGDPVALGDTVQAAGFNELAVIRRFVEARFPSPEEFVERLSAGGPSARRALEQLSPEALQQVKAEVRERLAPYIDKDGVRIITTANIAIARR
jgi:SAM-dependent methyltransferase